ncbi:MAG: response regulator [Pseudomonadota bacterium]
MTLSPSRPLATLIGVLLALSRIGTHGLSESDARRVMMSNTIALTVIASHLQFSIMHLLHRPLEHLPVVLALLASSGVLCCAIWINHRRHYLYASTLMALDVTAVLLQNDWYLGNALGARLFFFAAIPAVFLMMPPSAWRLITLLIILFGSSYMLSQFAFDDAQIPTHDDFITAYRVLCAFSTFGMLGLFFWLFYRETHRVEMLREQAALQNLERYREVVENVGDGIYRVSREGRVLSANPALAQMLGDESVDALMARITDFGADVIAGHSERAALYDALRAAGRVSGFELHIQRRDGSRFWGSLSTRVVRDASGHHIAFDGLLADISERRRMEQLTHAREAAEAATHAKSEFLAKMSHEIRTPMNAIIGFTELALRDNSEPRRLNYLEQIRSASRSLLGIINDILDLSKIEAGKLTMEQQDFELPALLDKLSGLFTLQAAHKSIAISLTAPPALPPLRGDPLRLEQVLINLLNNAIKFTERGSVSLDVAVQSQTHDVLQLQFSVRDTGVGIAPEQAGKLFAAFSQVDDSTTRKFGGTGLGLVICKQLVEMMGGRIWLEDAPGPGCLFRFTARFGIGVAKPAAGSPLTSPAAPISLKGVRLLLVEDNTLNQMLTSDLLRGHGVIVDVAANGEQAVTAVGLNQYDLVLMDVQMPVMDGLEATRWIRSNAHHAQLPILAMTANAMESDRQQCLDAGMNDFITKPIDVEQVLAVIGRHLRQSVPR